MKQLLVIASLVVVTLTANAKELESFLGVKFGESIHQDKFIAFDDFIKRLGVSPSDMPSFKYQAFKDKYIYKLPKPFKTYKVVFVRPNERGEVDYIGVFEFFNGEFRAAMRDKWRGQCEWVIETYGKDTVLIDETKPALYNKLKNVISSPSASTTVTFYGFTNESNNLSQIITSAILCDHETGDGMLGMIAEDFVLGNAPAKPSTDNIKSVNGDSKTQLTRENDLLAKDKTKKQVADEVRQKTLDSFCGIKFGVVVNGKMNRTDGGRYLICKVLLNVPFRGHETALVYASVKTKRVFRVDIAEFRMREGADIVDVMRKRYGFEPERTEWGVLYYICDWKFSNAEISFYPDYGASCDSFLSGERPSILSATNLEWKRIADEEFEKESGGDGSSVL